MHDLNIGDAARANSLSETNYVRDAVTCKSVDNQTTVIRWRYLDRGRVQRKDTVVISHDFLDERDFERKTWVFLHITDLTELKD